MRSCVFRLMRLRKLCSMKKSCAGSMKDSKKLILFSKSKISSCSLNRRVKQLTVDNQMYLQKIMEMKEQQAEAFNQANKICMEAQKLKTESLKASKLEEEKS